MLHELKKKIIHETLLFLWGSKYLTCTEALDLIEELEGLDCCQVNHWLKLIKPIFLEEYPTDSKVYHLS